MADLESSISNDHIPHFKTAHAKSADDGVRETPVKNSVGGFLARTGLVAGGLAARIISPHALAIGA